MATYDRHTNNSSQSVIHFHFAEGKSAHAESSHEGGGAQGNTYSEGIAKGFPASQPGNFEHPRSNSNPLSPLQPIGSTLYSTSPRSQSTSSMYSNDRTEPRDIPQPYRSTNHFESPVGDLEAPFSETQSSATSWTSRSRATDDVFQDSRRASTLGRPEISFDQVTLRTDRNAQYIVQELPWFHRARIFKLADTSDINLRGRTMIILGKSVHGCLLCLSLCRHANIRGYEDPGFFETHVKVYKSGSEPPAWPPNLPSRYRQVWDPLKIEIPDSELFPDAWVNLEHVWLIKGSSVRVADVGNVSPEEGHWSKLLSRHQQAYLKILNPS